MLEEFQEILNELMTDDNLNIERLSVEIKCHRSAIDCWVEGRYYPSINSLIKIADFFHCSIDYLFGLTNKKEFEPNYVSNFLLRYEELREKCKLSNYALAKACETGTSTISKWKKNKSIPEVAKIIKLAEAFGCSIEYLIGRC